MADKEATVYIIDQGSTMGSNRNGSDETKLDYCLRYIWDKICTTMEANRKTWTMGILGLRTDRTKHASQDDPGYKNISIQQHITGPYLMSHLKEARDMIKVSQTEMGDAISAIVIATMMINDFTKKLKYRRKIVLVTDGRGHIDGDDIDDIAQKLNEDNIELLVLGVDFDDPEYGFKEENKDTTKTENEQLLKSLCDKCNDGIFANISEAIEELDVPRLKEKRPYATYKGPLCLGDPEKYGNERAVKIEVERYFRTKKAAPPGASRFVQRNSGPSGDADLDGDTEMGGIPTEDGGLASIKSQIAYKINDESEIGGKRDIDRETLAKGYSYGRTAVPISAAEDTITKLETLREFTIIGFVPEEGYKRFLGMSESCLTIATQTSDQDRMALSSFVRAMAENESYAIARFVGKDSKDPVLLLLAPIIEPDVEGLVDVELPFQEDIRSYRFPPLDHVVTFSGAVLSKHRNLPTDDLTKVMDAYVDNMDLSNFGQDEDGNPAEYLTIEESYRVDLHRINHAIRERASQPDAPLPPIPKSLLKFQHPPSELVAASQKYLDKLVEVAGVKKVPDEVKGKGKHQKATPKSGLDVQALLAKRRGSALIIDPDNCIPEFRQVFEGNNQDDVVSAIPQFIAITKDLIARSMGPQKYDRVYANLRELRERLIEHDEPKKYNAFMRELKSNLLAEEDAPGNLGGRRELFWNFKGEKLGLIDEEASGRSDVTAEEAARFWDMSESTEMAIRSAEREADM